MSTIKVTNLQNPSASSPAFVLNTDGTCSQLGIRNALINGNPTINQRGYVSGTATTAANEYTLDRWRVVVSGESVTWTDSENVRTVTAPAGGVEQVIEGINILSGTYTLNWTGTATATVDGSSVSKGGNVTLTGGTNCTVRFSNGTFSLAQLEPGSVATPFEHRSYGDELAKCQRYFSKSYDQGVAPGTNTAVGCHALRNWDGSDRSGIPLNTRWPVTMRATPSITFYNLQGTSGAISEGGNSDEHSNSRTVLSTRGAGMGGVAGIDTSAGVLGLQFYSWHYTASAEL
jgi:hypothetical protein